MGWKRRRMDSVFTPRLASEARRIAVSNDSARTFSDWSKPIYYLGNPITLTGRGYDEHSACHDRLLVL